MSQQHNYEETLQYVNTCSKPSELRITDMRFANLAARRTLRDPEALHQPRHRGLWRGA